MKTNLAILLLLITCTSKPGSAELEFKMEKEVVCFVYHRFDDQRYPSTNTSIQDFEQHLAYLARNNFQVLSFSEAIKYVKSGEPVKKTAVITIDDGYQSFYKNGFPLLKKYKMPATLFINTKTVGGSDYMNWDQLKDVLRSNIEIGNHTHSHDFFLNEGELSRYASFEKEITTSQSIILKQLNITPDVFSYPYGEFDTKMKEIVANAGFIGAAAQNSGVISSISDFFMCPRFPMSEAYSETSKFIEKASMKSLKIVDMSPKDFTMPKGQRPLLKLTIDNTDLTISQLQCFVQGGQCELKVLQNHDNKTTVSVQALSPIKNRRRTLYTITVPDTNGVWHWYSHLWVNTSVN